MTTKIRLVAGSPSFILYATSALAAAIFFVGRHYGLTRVDWPGWLQAVGSVWAILVAVWVPWQQAEANERREKQKEADDVAALLRSIRTELSGTLDRAQNVFGGALDKLPRGKPFLAYLPVSEDPFIIYNALLPKIGTVRDDTTRDQIVRTYKAARGFILTIHRHNSMYETWDLSDSNGDKVIALKKYEELLKYTPLLQESYREMKREIAKLLPMLP
ncbi:hypothetical protein IFT64_12090 [Oxalobacteraceae sp. CFBP 8753]|nr:hypothetical protein [Oxalobacteraceae sp. CFBP 8753]